MLDSALTEYKKQETLAEARREKLRHDQLLSEAKTEIE